LYHQVASKQDNLTFAALNQFQKKIDSIEKIQQQNKTVDQ
jgi:hypothetical protein